MGWREKIWVQLDEENWDRSVRAVRELRSISAVALIGTTYWVAHGTYGLRSLQENGGIGFVVDTRLSGTGDEIYRTAECLFLHGAIGVTMHPWIDLAGIDQVKKAAAGSLKTTQRVVAPSIYTSVRQADYQAIVESKLVRPTELEFMQHLFQTARTASGRGVITDDPQALFQHKAKNGELIVPISRNAVQRSSLADNIAGLFMRGAAAVMIPTSTLPPVVEDSDIDRAHRQLSEMFPPEEEPTP